MFVALASPCNETGWDERVYREWKKKKKETKKIEEKKNGRRGERIEITGGNEENENKRQQG